MSPRHPIARTTALALMLALIVPSAALSQNDALGNLAKAAKKRGKEVVKQEQAARMQVRVVGAQAEEAKNQGLYIESGLYMREKRALEIVVTLFAHERRLLEEIMATNQYRQAIRSGMSMQTISKVSEMRRLTERITLSEKEARGHLSYSKSQGKEREVAILERELATYQHARAQLGHERATLDHLLAATGAPSVSEVEQRFRDSDEARRRREQEKEEERRRASEYVGGLILTLGLVTALALVLRSNTATPAQKKEAQGQLDGLKLQAKEQCLLRGGVFMDGGAYAVGTCTK